MPPRVPVQRKMSVEEEMAKLGHKIIVFTGGIASGKTTIKQAFIHALERVGVRVYEISGIRDLYLPFAQQRGLILKKETYTRQETTALMEVLYASHGRSLGSHLLKTFLKDKSLSQVYIVDSKRNPEGIQEVRTLFKNSLVVGVHAALKDREARMRSRKRAFDKKIKTKKEILESFREEEKIFSVTKSVRIADEIFINDTWFPHELEVRIADILEKYGIAQYIQIDRTVSAPSSRVTARRVLKAGEMRKLLDHFARKTGVNTVFVVQGGNRYAATYLTQRAGLRCVNIKLLCASKVPCAVILNTILDDRDKMLRLDKGQGKKILAIVNTYTKEEKDVIRRACKMYSVTDKIETVLKEETISVLIKIFAQETLKTHFTYPFSDADLEDEFKKTREVVEKGRIQVKHLGILQIIVSRTTLRGYLHEQEKNLAFLDDVFYRGRTLFSIAVILKIFKISQKQMKLHTLCVDRVSASLTSKHLQVMDRRSVYPFENSIRTENGYWQEKNGYFSFVDMGVYRGWLQEITDTKAAKKINRGWERMIKDICAKIPKPHVEHKEMIALIWLVIYHRCHNLPLSTSAVADQRGKGIGYCVAFVKCIEHFIPQEEPAAKRWAFKERIKSLVAEMQNNQCYKDDIDKATAYYRAHAEAIDFEGLIS